jgi:valyl-tRNA synthetase
MSLLTLEDRWVLSALSRTVTEMNRCLTEYTFDRAATRGYEFFWNDFCAIYLELAKPVLTGKVGSPAAKKNKQKLLVILLLSSIRLLHPITPFITEEVFSSLKTFFGPLDGSKCDPYTKEAIAALNSPACIKAPYPTVLSEPDPETEKTFAEMNDLVRAVRNLRAEMKIPPQEKTDLIISGVDLSVAQENKSVILALTSTTNITFTHEDTSILGASHIVGHLKLTIPISESLKLKEKERLVKELAKAQELLKSTQAKLSNEGFRAKAPAEVVEKLVQAEDQTTRQIAEMTQKLEKL